MVCISFHHFQVSPCPETIFLAICLVISLGYSTISWQLIRNMKLFIFSIFEIILLFNNSYPLYFWLCIYELRFMLGSTSAKVCSSVIIRCMQYACTFHRPSLAKIMNSVSSSIFRMLTSGSAVMCSFSFPSPNARVIANWPSTLGTFPD